MREFGTWIKDHQGDIIGFFRDAGDKVKQFTAAVGGAENALKILAGIYVGNKILGATGSAGAASGAATATSSAVLSALFRVAPWAAMLYSANAGPESTTAELNSIGATWQNQLNGPSSQHQLEGLLHGIMMTESGGNPLAYNPSGATGAYQFMPGTARDLGLRVDSQVDERLDPEKSRAAASIYMRQLLTRYNGNIDNALRAYNWGMGNVDKWIANGSNINELPAETRNYTDKVRNYWGSQQRNLSAPVIPAASMDNSQTSSTHIGQVIVNSNPQSVDALTKSVEQQAQRASTSASFSSSVR